MQLYIGNLCKYAIITGNILLTYIKNNILFISFKTKTLHLEKKAKTTNLHTWLPPFWPLKKVPYTSLLGVGYFWRTLNSRLSPLSIDQTLAQEVVWKMSGLRKLWTKIWVARKTEEEYKGFCNILCFRAQAFSLFGWFPWQWCWWRSVHAVCVTN